MLPPSLLAFVIGLAAGVPLTVVLLPVLRRAGFERTNFQGQPLCTGGGVLFAAGAVGWLLWDRSAPGCWIAWSCLGFALLGLLDDRWGTPEFKGLRGHLRALRSGRLTTGQAKAAGGLVLAGVIAWQVEPSMEAVLCALLIALGANFFNLLDLRPLRALKAFWLIGGALAWAAPAPLSLLLGLSLPYSRLEASRAVMLGDAGSNALGAALGVSAALVLPVWAQVVVVAGLVGFHLWAERNSLSAWIERHAWARTVDGWGWRKTQDA